MHAAPFHQAEQSTLEGWFCTLLLFTRRSKVRWRLFLHAAPGDDGRQTQDTVSKQTKKHMMRMNKKPFYTAPEAEFLDVRFEDGLLNVSGGAGGDDTIIDDEGDY